MGNVYFNPLAVYGPLGVAFPLAVAQAAGVAKTSAPVRTGELRRSIGHKVVGYHGYVYSGVRHAASQEFGAAPHKIAVSRKKALANPKMGFGPVAGPVNHPGNPGNHFMLKAAQAFRPIFIATAGKLFRG